MIKKKQLIIDMSEPHQCAFEQKMEKNDNFVYFLKCGVLFEQSFV